MRQHGSNGFCCPAHYEFGDSHTQKCYARRGKWVILLDEFCDDPAQPWTIWRWAPAIRDYSAMAVAESYEGALDKVTEFIRHYTEVRELMLR